MVRERMRSRSRDDDDKPKKSAGFRGAAGMDRVEDEMRKARERRDKPYAPMRYKADYSGEQKNEIIILDKSSDDLFFIHEHSVKDSEGNWGRQFEICLKEEDNCPLCKIAERDNKTVAKSNYAMVLTVLDLRPYKNKKTKKTVTHSKKLFVVKGLQVPEWLDTIKSAEDEFGTLRGVYMVLSRNDKKSAATGIPKSLKKDFYGDDAGHKPFALVDFADIKAEFGNDEIMSDDGKRVIKKKNQDIKPFDYEALFPVPDADELADKYGSNSSAGSRRDLDDDDWDEDKSSRRKRSRDEDEDEDEPKTRSRMRRRSEPDEDDEADEEEIPKARKRRNPSDDDSPEPPRRTRQVEEDDEDESDEEETPRRRSRSVGKKSKSSKIDETEDEDEDDKPKRTRKVSRSEPEDDEETDDDEDVIPRRRSVPKTKNRSRKPSDDEDDDGPF